jgi:hypothetical protein
MAGLILKAKPPSWGSITRNSVTAFPQKHWGLAAVRNWPDTMFFRYIRKIQEVQLASTASYNFWQLRVLYQDIVLYKDSASRNLLLLALKKTTGWKRMCHSFAIWGALHKYPDPMYTPVLQELKIKAEHIDGLRALIDENEGWEY